MKYLDNQNNLIRTASLTATNILASNVIWRTDQEDKVGGGDVSLGGDFTGQADQTIDVQIVDNTISGAPSTSDPVFNGVGNGVLSDLEADATVDVQTITITLVDLGTSTLAAQAPFQGVALKAKDAGSAGNNITVAINRTGLVKTETIYTLPGDFQETDSGNTGDEWNFGHVLLDPNTGNVPDTAPRVSFGLDQQVYRLYKKFDGTRYTYYTTPDPVRSVAQGSKVYSITGAYTITVDNTVDAPEVFTEVNSHPIVTLYDALTALQSSAIVEVVGVVVNDKKPNGMAIDDLSVYTNTYVQTITATGSSSVVRAVPNLQFSTGQSGSTETITLTCTANNLHNAEVWDVYGSNSGQLPQAVTGQAYTNAPYSLLIPTVNADGGSVPASAGMLVELVPMDRGEGEQMPALCVDRPRLGSAAHDGVWEFVYVSRPPTPCSCANGTITGGPNAVCLGLEVGGGGGAVATKAEIILRKAQLTAALRGFIESNTTPPEAVDNGDVIWLKTAFAIFSAVLTQLDNDSATLDLDYPDFQASHAYTKGTIIYVPGEGNRFLVTGSGTSGSSAPSWPASAYDAVTSGTAVFQNIGPGPLNLWDDAFTDLKTDAALLSGQENPQDYPSWAAGVTFHTGSRVVPTQQSGIYLQHGGIYDDAGSLVVPQPAPVATGSIEPIWNLTDTGVTEERVDVDTRIHWITHTFTDLSVEPGVSDTFYDRYRAQMNDVLLAAGVDPEDFEEASVEGDGCWQDAKGDSWFAYSGDDRAYLPIQPGVYYHSSVQTMDGDGKPVYNSTHEWAFGPKFGDCVDKLKNGDRIRVTITGTGSSGGGNSGYQQGDAFLINVVHADPVQLTGGQDGDDTFTWSVVGSEHLFDQYLLNTVTPNTYSDDGLTFLITPGSIPYDLGDTYTFEVEGGRFQWRKDGGSWTGPVSIANTVSIGTDGLEVSFVPGTAPSWVAGDTWSFKAEATNGPEGIRSLTDESMAWQTSQALVMDLGGSPPDVSLIMIGEHTIPSTATISVEGSNDNFSTTPFVQSIAWAERNMFALFEEPQTYSKYRLNVNAAGSIQWLYLGTSALEMKLTDGQYGTNGQSIRELGDMIYNRRLPTILQRDGICVDVTHNQVSNSSMEALGSMLKYAGENEQGRFGIIPNDNSPDCAIVTVNPSDTEIQFTDEFDFQTEELIGRAITVKLSLEAIP